MSGDSPAGMSRRQTLAAGTPEQIHLTWGDDPARSVVVSWASPGPADRPRVRIGQRVIAAVERRYTDPLRGAVRWTYHARVDRLRPGATYGYAVTADNDANAADPFSATFTTAPPGRAAFRFTSFGDLATANPSGAGSYGPVAHAVGAVETFQPLFHLINGGLAGADPDQRVLSSADRARAWRDFGNNVQASAANRPWLPVPGSHELELGDGEEALASYLTRYTLPSNGVDGLEGRWYAFRVGTALFVCLSGDDVAYAGAGTLTGPAAAGPPGYARGYSGGAQTRWLESTLSAARSDAAIDWIVVQVHQCACTSAPGGNGSDLGIRREWLPLFDAYEVDLVLSGHDHGYERSFPVRGYDAGAGWDAVTSAAADTRTPHPVTTVDSGVFDTSQGTVHLVLGGGGVPGDPRDSVAPVAPLPRVARVFTRPARPVPDQRLPGSYARTVADAVEAATWSARRDASAGYGIAVFDVKPGSEAGGQTSIGVRYYHAVGADPAGPRGTPAADYTLFETFTLVRPRSDGRRWQRK